MIATSEITKLTETTEWKALAEIPDESEKLNLFAILTDKVCENTWSRFLAYLFTSSENHNLKTKPFEAWLKTLEADHARKIVEILPENFETFAKFNWRTDHVDQVDRRFVDIVVEIRDSNHKILGVVGIENKVGSDEGNKQLSDYQDAIAGKFQKSLLKILIFLTPYGKSPKTSNKTNTECPCFPQSYESLLSMCHEIMPSEQNQLKILLNSLHDFIEQQVLGVRIMNTKAKELIRSLYQDGNNRRALEYIRNFNPGLVMMEDLKKAIEEAFPKIFKGSAWKWKYSPQKCDKETPQEIKLELSQRDDNANFLIIYLLRANNANPSINDNYTMFVAIWICEGGEVDAKNLAEQLDFAQKPSSLPNFNNWRYLWQGETYKLLDFGEKDIDNLKAIFGAALDETYAEIKSKIPSFFV